VEVLRQEVIETEHTRNDLLKWKLGLVGGLGAAGLGLAGSRRLHHADLILAAIPPVAVYVDLLCRNLAIKMLVIGTFAPRAVDGSQDPWQILTDYEDHVNVVRELPFH
jgi:hypothetical protein